MTSLWHSGPVCAMRLISKVGCIQVQDRVSQVQGRSMHQKGSVSVWACGTCAGPDMRVSAGSGRRVKRQCHKTEQK
jgi:hypothetical protein